MFTNTWWFEHKEICACIASAKTLRSADARAAGIFGEPSTRDDKFGVVGGHKSCPPQACIKFHSPLAKEKRSSMVIKQILQIMSNMHQAWTCLQHQVTKCWQTDCQELEDATERPTSSLFLNRGWSWLSTTGPKLLCGHDIAIGPTNQSQTSKLDATPKLQVWFSRNDSVRVATELFDYFDDHPK